MLYVHTWLASITEFYPFVLLPPVINGEKAAFNLPVFAEKRERTLDLLIKGVEQKFRVRPSGEKSSRK